MIDAILKEHTAAQHEPENEPFVSLASVQEPVAWLIPGSITTDPELAKANGDKAVAIGKISTQQWNPEDHYKDGWRDALESVKRATPPAAQPAPVQEPVSMDAIYGAWHGAGVDIAGGNWSRFVGMLPPLYTTPPAQPTVPDAIGPNEDELPAYAAGWNDCRAEMLKGNTP
jgi:hypothetical protein